VINQTKVFDEVNSAADGEVRRIIAANGGPALAKSGPNPNNATAAQASAAHSSIDAPAAAALVGSAPVTSKFAAGNVPVASSRLLK
jgi:membrane fusion protein (multidrug efflux system)